MSLVYSCSMCPGHQDIEGLPDSQRNIWWLVYTGQPFCVENIYLCRDCWKEVKRMIEEERKYYEDMARNAQLQIDHADHDCGTLQGQGCSVCVEYDDGYGKDCA